MEKIVDKDKCTGCTACMTKCPKNAISMKIDIDGFKYPIIDQNKCINCGLCRRTCPVINTNNNVALNLCYAAYNKNNKELLSSSSGGIFSLIANYIFKNNGIVIGASLDKANKLHHIAITKKEDLDKLKGSKYIQSDLENIFSYVRENINEKKILFVGTPCQVAGLKMVINNSNLVCVDIICHGVPTPKLFEKYIRELETQNDLKILNYNFRDKKIGWEKYSNTIRFEKKQISKLAKHNKYMQLYLSNVALRNSCYNCNFKLGNKYSDITLGDFWGIKQIYPDFYNKNGVSAIIINTEVGKKIFDELKSNLNFRECTINDIVKYNNSLIVSAKLNNKRDEFFQQLNDKSVDYLNKKYKNRTNIIRKIIRKIKYISGK